MMKRAWIIIFALSLSACGSMPEFDPHALDNAREPSGPVTNENSGESSLQIICMNVGQGDATLIIAPNGDTMLIDAGEMGMGRNVIIPYLQSEEIDSLDYLVATHYHADHIGGIPDLIAGPDGSLETDDDIVPTKGVFDRGDSFDASSNSLFPFYFSVTEGLRHALNPGDIIEIGELDLEVVAVNGKLVDGTEVDLRNPPDENAASIALIIKYSGFRMFIGGDLTGGGNDKPDIETPLAPLVGDIDVLRVSHHGSKTSTNQTFVDMTQPEVAIISLGDDNDYYHPHPSVIERLLASGATIYQTERGANTNDDVIVTDGHVTINVEKNGEYAISP